MQSPKLCFGIRVAEPMAFFMLSVELIAVPKLVRRNGTAVERSSCISIPKRSLGTRGTLRNPHKH